MNLFLKKIIQFIILLYGSLFAFVLVSNNIIKKHADFKLKPNINKVVLGNSHPAGTYNDSLISNFKNLADPGDCHFYSYLKLKEILKQNPQIDSVYLEFYPNTILEWEDSKLWKKHQIPNYNSFFDLEDHFFLASINGLSYQQELLKGISKNLNRILFERYNFKASIGGFRHVTGSQIESIIDTLSNPQKRQYTFQEKKLSKHDLVYLKKIVSLCDENKTALLFIRSPYHNLFDGRRCESIFQNYRKNNFDTIPFLDFQNFELKNTEFKDLRHLNNKGAKKFSTWFNESF